MCVCVCLHLHLLRKTYRFGQVSSPRDCDLNAEQCERIFERGGLIEEIVFAHKAKVIQRRDVILHVDTEVV